MKMQADIADHQYKKPKVYRPEPVQYDDGIETNIYGIAEQICSRPPQPPCTIQLIMDHDVPTDTDLNDFEFDLLRTFVMACLKILFGPNVNPLKLPQKDMDKLSDYVNSIGYRLITETEETETSVQFTMSFKRYESPNAKSLEHLRKYMNPST